MLESDGIDIARRTVAKYREAMRIPSSVERRREKHLMARRSSCAGRLISGRLCPPACSIGTGHKHGSQAILALCQTSHRLG